MRPEFCLKAVWGYHIYKIVCMVDIRVRAKKTFREVIEAQRTKKVLPTPSGEG